jgi:hypothetical protein
LEMCFELTSGNAIISISLNVAAVWLHSRIQNKELLHSNPILVGQLRTCVIVDVHALCISRVSAVDLTDTDRSTGV